MQNSLTKTARLAYPVGGPDEIVPGHEDDDETSVYKATPTARWVNPPGRQTEPLPHGPATSAPSPSPMSPPLPSRTKTIPYGVLPFTPAGPPLVPEAPAEPPPVDSTPPPMLTLMLLVALAMLLASGGMAVTALLDLV